MKRDAASLGHFCDSDKRFKSANENATGLAFRFAGDVEAIVIAVDEINVGEAGRSEED